MHPYPLCSIKEARGNISSDVAISPSATLTFMPPWFWVAIALGKSCHACHICSRVSEHAPR